MRALTFNGGVPGPTLVVRPGDVLSVAFQNQLAMPTNLHTHGLHVTPGLVSPGVYGDYVMDESTPVWADDYGRCQYRVPTGVVDKAGRVVVSTQVLADEYRARKRAKSGA